MLFSDYISNAECNADIATCTVTHFYIAFVAVHDHDKRCLCHCLNVTNLVLAMHVIWLLYCAM